MARVIAAWDMWAKPAPAGALDHPSRIFLIDPGAPARDLQPRVPPPAAVVQDVETVLAEGTADTRGSNQPGRRRAPDRDAGAGFVVLNPVGLLHRGRGAAGDRPCISSVTDGSRSTRSEGDDLPGDGPVGVGRGCDLIVAVGRRRHGLGGRRRPGRAEARLVVLPLGTANVLARELGIPVDLEGPASSARLREAGSLAGTDHDVFRLDAMKVGDRHYFTQVGVGIDALMIRDTADEHKRRFGRLAYLWTAATRLVGFQPRRFTMTIDGRRSVPGRRRWSSPTPASSASRRSAGAPTSAPTTAASTSASSGPDAARLPRALLARRPRPPPPEPQRPLSGRRPSVIIATSRPLPVQADGEILGETPSASRSSRAP